VLALLVMLVSVSEVKYCVRQPMDGKSRQLKRALGPLRRALETHYRALEELESTLLEFEELLDGVQERQEPRPLVQQRC
jgi:hypothetical protein